MKEILKYAGVLCLVTLIAGSALSYVNTVTKPRILAQQEKNLKMGLYSVLPGSDSGVVKADSLLSDLKYYTGYSNPDTTGIIGYALPVVSKGYSSNIQTLVGFDTTGAIISIKILFQQETPGLGTKVEEIRPRENKPWFQEQFKTKMADDLVLDKKGGPIECITGATITSKAITDGIREGANRFFQARQSSIN